jgi:hypothetical protein
MTARIRQPGQNRKERTARKFLDSQNRTGRIGQAELNRQN